MAWHIMADPHEEGTTWSIYEGLLVVCPKGSDCWYQWERYEELCGRYPETPERVVVWIALRLHG